MDVVQQLDLDRPVLEVAPGLLGVDLVRTTDEGVIRARIVETEAYREDDPASHSYPGRTPRSRVMFGPPGYWYVYKCYGIHWMMNVVCGREGKGQAVLIRAAEPVRGRRIMIRHRDMEGTELTNGPGKLAQALQVDDRLNKKPIDPSTGFYLEPGAEPSRIYESPRVGIQRGTDRFWRFFTDSHYVSEASQNENRRRRN